MQTEPVGQPRNFDHAIVRIKETRSRRSWFLVAAGLSVAAVTLSTPFPQNQARAELDNCADPPPIPGPGRPWEADIQVSTYSSANTRSGNLFTVIPIIGWSGRGPDLNMVLYHNAASVDKPATWHDNVGFTLGEGWTIAYSDQLILTEVANDEVTVVYDDGTEDVYTWSGTAWEPSPGIFSKLTQDSQNQNLWRVTHKDQSFYEFTDVGDIARLTRIVDAVGNDLTVSYTNDRITSITAAGRSLEFMYDGDYLWKFKDPGEGIMDDRYWTLVYDANGRLEKVQDPLTPAPEIRFTYDTDGRIATISDKVLPDGDPDIYAYDYYGTGTLLAPGRIHFVTDPDDPSTAEDGYEQEFETICALYQGEERFYTIYHDRRGSSWKFYYYWPSSPGTGPFLYPDGNLMETHAPITGATHAMYYYDDRTVMWALDSLGRGWEATYDTNGNMLTRTDTLLHEESWEYDAYNNVTFYTDKAGNITEFVYDHAPTYPTLLTDIIEPPAYNGGDEAITTLEYYLALSGDEDRFGLLKRVEDPNGVVTGFDYDGYGQPSLYTEGEVSGSPIYCEMPTYDGGSRMTRTEFGCATSQVAAAMAGGGSASYDALNRLEGTSCLGVQARAAGFTVENMPGGFPPLPCNYHEYQDYLLAASVDGILYTPKGEIAELPLGLDTWNGLKERIFTFDQDNLGRQTLSEVESDETGSAVIRHFDYTYHMAHRDDPDEGVMWVEREGPDGIVTRYTYDRQYRLESIVRDTSNPTMEAEYTYYDNGLVDTIAYDNGTSIKYEYDDGNRVTFIKHKNTSGTDFLRMEYGYTVNDLPASIDEYGANEAHIDYEYDDRHRLISEIRLAGGITTSTYYTYDLGGNRQSRQDYVNSPAEQVITTTYEYDYEDVNKYQTANNRLMMEVRTDTTGIDQELSRKYYYYNDRGNVEWIVTGPPEGGMQYLMGGGEEGGGEEMSGGEEVSSGSEENTVPPSEGGTTGGSEGGGETESSPSPSQGEGGGEGAQAMGGGGASCSGFEDLYSATRLVYAENGRTLNYISQQQWCWYDGYTCTAGCGDCPRPTSYTVLNATEYRYDQARERYYELALDPADFKAGTIDELGTQVPIWMDFENSEAYSRYRIDSPTSILSLVRYEPGLWRSDNSASAYLHNDHLGTLRYTSNNSGTPQNPTAFSAFGEQISGTSPQFGYAGAWGYRRDSASPFLHVGHRYYDPASGRFLQRDPIGLRGGLNSYLYMEAKPTIGTDSTGLFPDYYWDKPPRRRNPPAVEDPGPGVPPHHPITDAGREIRKGLDPRDYDSRGRGSKWRNRNTGRFIKGPSNWTRALRALGRIATCVWLLEIQGDNAPYPPLGDEIDLDIECSLDGCIMR